MKLNTSPANIRLGEDVLKTPSRRLQRNNSLSSKTSWNTTVTLHYNKNEQPFCDLTRFWLCSTSL